MSTSVTPSASILPPGENCFSPGGKNPFARLTAVTGCSSNGTDEDTFVPGKTSFVRDGTYCVTVYDVRDRLSMVKSMGVTELQTVLALPSQNFQVQARVLSAARARLRKLVKTAEGSALARSKAQLCPRQPSSRALRLNEKQRDHLIRFGRGLEQDLFQLGKSKATSKALYFKGLLWIVEEREGDAVRYDLTDRGLELYKTITGAVETVEAMKGTGN